jgi:DDE family transposase
MAEVGLLPFAQTALKVAHVVLPPYRSRFSKHQFTQPQLLAVLCRKRYEDWTFRETEVRLRERRELRRVLQLRSVPVYTTLYRFPKRLDNKKIDQALGEAARRVGTVGRRRRARVAVDATGLAQGAVSTFFVRRMYHHTGQPLPWRHWLKWLVTVDVDRQLLLSQTARRGPGNDGANLPALVEAASQVVPIGLLLADAEFDSERNHTYVRQNLRARSIIPAKRGQKTWRIHGVRAEMRHSFPRRQYARGSLVETVFSTVKRQLSARASGRSLFMQLRQALLLGLTYHLDRL